jgi:nucleoside-diphosphate-sugar epimerase
MSGDRVLVTGGAGVIGRELLALLSARGDTVLSADREPLPGPPPPGVEHHRVDLARDDIAFVWDFRPRVVYHLAASFERTEESPEHWAPNWLDNVVLSHRIAEGARRSGGVETLVFASSYLTYDPDRYLFDAPDHEPTPLREDDPLRPRNLCGAAKLYAENEFAFARDLLDGPARVVLARIFRVYGLGSRDVISRWVRAALRGEPLVVYQRQNRFDYVFARDVAEGLIRMADSAAADGPLNLATGHASSIGEVLDALAAALPERPPRTEERTVDAPFEASRADLTRLMAATGWQPGIGLAEGVRALVDHERERADGG